MCYYLSIKKIGNTTIPNAQNVTKISPELKFVNFSNHYCNTKITKIASANCKFFRSTSIFSWKIDWIDWGVWGVILEWPFVLPWKIDWIDRVLNFWSDPFLPWKFDRIDWVVNFWIDPLFLLKYWPDWLSFEFLRWHSFSCWKIDWNDWVVIVN